MISATPYIDLNMILAILTALQYLKLEETVQERLHSSQPESRRVHAVSRRQMLELVFWSIRTQIKSNSQVTDAAVGLQLLER